MYILHIYIYIYIYVHTYTYPEKFAIKFNFAKSAKKWLMSSRLRCLIFFDKLIHDEVYQETADLVTFSEEILHGKLHFFCSVIAAENQF